MVIAISGCTSSPPPTPSGPVFDPQWSERALVSTEGHDHADPLQHLNLTTPNFAVLGHDPLNSPFYGMPAGATLCGDAAQSPDGRRIAAVESRSKVGFSLIDVTNATRPVWLGELVMENTRVYDLAVVPDGRHVVLVTANVENAPVPLPVVAGDRFLPSSKGESDNSAPRMVWRSPCGPDREIGWPVAAAANPVPVPAQVILIDFVIPENPVMVDNQPISGYGHSVFVTAIDGRTWVLVSTLGPFPPVVPGSVISGWEFLELQPNPVGGARLVPLSTFYVRGDAAAGDVAGQFAHDGWIAKHPVTGQTVGYLVGGDRVTTVDLADARQPRAISTWSDAGPGREGFSGNMHSVIPLDRQWNGKHYTIVGPEFGNHPTDHPSGIIWVLDTTDPAAPAEVAAWTLPHEVEWSGEYMFSNHYYGIHNRTLFVSMYHGGVWAVDLSPVLAGTAAGFVSLQSVGVFMPVAPGIETAVQVRWAPTLEEILTFSDGTMVTFDSFTGLWTLRFDEANPAPAPEPWPIGAPH